MRSIRIPAKFAKALVSEMPHPLLDAALDLIRKQLAPVPVSSARKKTAAKRATKRDETAEIRAALVIRADGKCESCGNAEPEEMDHFWGRAKAPQSVRNCWLICRQCHHEKTNNQPDAAFWLSVFQKHCDRHGIASEAWKVSARLESIALLKEAAQ